MIYQMFTKDNEISNANHNEKSIIVLGAGPYRIGRVLNLI